MEHYRYHIAYVIKTRSERIVDTVEFPPEHIKIPGVSNQEAATNAALYLKESISNPSPKSPFEPIGDRQLQAINKLAYILKQKTTPQDAPPTRIQRKLGHRPNITILPRKQHPQG